MMMKSYRSWSFDRAVSAEIPAPASETPVRLRRRILAGRRSQVSVGGDGLFREAVPRNTS